MITDNKIADTYTDFGALNKIKHQAQQKSPEALKAVAQQFEALFLQTMLKSMRDSVQKSDLFNSSEQDMFGGLFDQQIALNISKTRGIGIADVIYRQLSNLPGMEAQSWGNKEEFIDNILPAAKKAAHDLNVPAAAVLSVTALETGWGQKVMRHPDGTNSFNLFGIKAGSSWGGSKVFASTLEFADGAMQKTRAAFRAYDSASESIEDFVSFLMSNPRYEGVIKQKHSNAEDFFNGLQQAGYATDPAYADKLKAVYENSVLKAALKNHDV